MRYGSRRRARLRRWLTSRPGDRALRAAHLSDPYVREAASTLREERAADKPLAPGITAEALPGFLRDHE